MGAVLTGVFASAVINPAGANGLLHGNSSHLFNQCVAVLVTWLFSATMSFLIIHLVDFLIGLRVAAEDEIEGLDSSQHGESGYNLEA